MAHRLDPLLRPTSIAIVGASARPHSVGNHTISNIVDSGFPGAIYPINPGYDELAGRKCYASFDDLPEAPQLAIFCVSDERIEQALDAAIGAGVEAVSIMSTLYVDNDSPPYLAERIRRKIADAGLVACGANGMGYYSIDARLSACGFDARLHEPPGNVALISHSGSGMCGIADCDERIRFNFIVSTGNELDATMDEYLDFALDLPDTRVVGLFIETARNPAGLLAALQKANDKQIPVVAIKVGKTRKSAELAVSHSGAIAGDDATYEALFDRFGVQRVNDMEELATALIVFASMYPIGDGGLVALHDSGGERQLMIDLADAFDVPLTELTEKSTERLKAVLDPELPAVNPLDGWSRGGPDSERNMRTCISAMMQDPGTALGALVLDRAADGGIYPEYVDRMKQARKESGKPVALVSAWQGTGSDPLVISTTHAGMPILDGVSPFLNSVRAMMNYRDFLAAPPAEPAKPAASTVTKWRRRLTRPEPLDEAEGMAMLADFGVNASPARIVRSEKELAAVAGQINWPAVAKTASGIAHKTEHGGVHLNIADGDALLTAFRDLQDRLGEEVLVAPMARPGVEMILGARQDSQFGPVVLFGFGGIYSEVLRDVAFALPPFDAAHARKMLGKLRMQKLLRGVRGEAPVDLDKLCEAAARFSAMVYALRQEITEIDINPLIASATDCVAVDALIVAGTAIKSN